MTASNVRWSLIPTSFLAGADSVWRLWMSCWWVCLALFWCVQRSEKICNNRCTESFLLSAGGCAPCFWLQWFGEEIGPDWAHGHIWDVRKMEASLGLLMDVKVWLVKNVWIARNLVKMKIHKSYLMFSRLPEFLPMVLCDFSWLMMTNTLRWGWSLQSSKELCCLEIGKPYGVQQWSCPETNKQAACTAFRQAGDFQLDLRFGSSVLATLKEWFGADLTSIWILGLGLI